jgi:hypothetical protein
MGHAALTIPRPEALLPATSSWARLPMVGMTLAVLGGIASAALAAGDPRQFFFSWLAAFVFVHSLALGCLYFVLIHHATQAGWGVVVRRLAEDAAATLPLFALLFLPLAFGLHDLYPWARPEAVAADRVLRWKQPFLNTPFFLARQVAYFVIWSAIALWCRALSRRQDEHPDPQLAQRLRRWSGPALVPLVLTHSLAAVDWLMSLDAHWYSTIFGVYCFSGAFMAAFALLAVVAVGLQRAGVLRGMVNTEHFHDLGKLLFAFTVFWAYIAFSQFLLIWYGNMPEETLWYRDRLHGSWLAVSAVLALGHFVLPFFFLMPRSMKRNPITLTAGAAWMLLMHLVDVHWLVMPPLHADGVRPALLDATTLLAVGGAFLFGFGWLLRADPLVPVGDPRLPESLGFENV